MILAGTGGTGVVTLGAILGMAAHLEGKGAGIMDMAGLAQKGGVVLTHVKLAESPADINAIRVAAGEADLVLGCDLVASRLEKGRRGDPQGRYRARRQRRHALPRRDHPQAADFELPNARLRKQLSEAAGRRARFVDATQAATTLLGTSLAANMLMLGYAWQTGLVPLGETSILRAISLNGEAVDDEPQRLRARPPHRRLPRGGRGDGRRRPARGAPRGARSARSRRSSPSASPPSPPTRTRRYAARYRALVERATSRRARPCAGLAPSLPKRWPSPTSSCWRSRTSTRSRASIPTAPSPASWAKSLRGRPRRHLSTSRRRSSARRNAEGKPIKTTFGPWMARLFPLIAKGKRLRGTRLRPVRPHRASGAWSAR